MGPGPLFKGMRASLPWWADDLRAELSAASAASRMLHSQQLVPWLLGDEVVGGRLGLRGRRVLVVGGGQTSAHLALLACAAGCARVVVAARRRLSLKPYDVDLEIVGDRRGEVRRPRCPTNQPTAVLLPPSPPPSITPTMTSLPAAGQVLEAPLGTRAARVHPGSAGGRLHVARGAPVVTGGGWG